jgi:hypothetical protein
VKTTLLALVLLVRSRAFAADRPAAVADWPKTDPAAAGAHRKDAPGPSCRLAEFTDPIPSKPEGAANWFYALPEHDPLCRPAEKLYADHLGAVKYGHICALDVGRITRANSGTLRENAPRGRRNDPHRTEHRTRRTVNSNHTSIA